MRKIGLLAVISFAFTGAAASEAFSNVVRRLWEDDDPPPPLLVDTTQSLGEPGTLFNQQEYDGRDATVLVSLVTPTISANTNIRCELTCMSGSFEQVIVNLKYGTPPTDVENDGTRVVRGGCPSAISLNTFHDANLYVSVANLGGTLNDGRVRCDVLEQTPHPTPAPTKKHQPGICFSETSTVHVQGKGAIEMRHLQVNDKVWVGNRGNTPHYETVYAFGHYQPTKTTEYLKIHTSSNRNYALEISAAHLLYLANKDEPVRADSVRPGDVLQQTTIDGAGMRTAARVTKVETISRKGAYMPLTKSGTIVVNDYHASAYVSILDDAPRVVTKFQSHFFLSEQTLLHWWLAPYRMVCLGISSKLCENDYNEEGIAYWLVAGRYIARVGDTWWIGFQLVGVAVFTLFMATCMALEAAVESLWLVSLVCVMVLLARRTSGRQTKQLKTH